MCPASDQAEVDDAAKKWAELWEADAEYPALDFTGVDDETLPELTPAMLRAAAASFPAATGVGADAISPKALCRLPEPLLEELAQLLMAAERVGHWSDALPLVLIVLLPKDGGGFRPIGLFPTLIRVWMRARSSTARDWEELTAAPELYGAKGMGAQRAAWTETFAAETAAQDNGAYAAVLLDLVKAFEKISHADLVAAARRHEFSLRILRLSLAAYRIARVIGVDGVYSKELHACKGITAGSGFATTELRMLLLDLMFELKKLWPVQLKLYVDDLTITAKGEQERVAADVAAATDHAVQRFQQLGLEVSTAKTTAIACNRSMVRRVVIKSHTKVAKGKGQAKLLGVGYTGGKRRTTAVMNKRISAFAGRIGKIRCLRSKGASAVQYVQAAGIPAMPYGGDCTGFSDTTLDTMVRLAATAITPPARGKNPRMVMQAFSPLTTAVDPSSAANLMPIKSWACAWWDNWAPHRAMTTAYRKTSARLAKVRGSAWSTVAGPVATLIATCKRIGWSSSDGRVFTDDLGDVVDVALDPPAAVVAAASRSIGRWAFEQVLRHLPTARAPPCSSSGSSSGGSSGRIPTHVTVDASPALKSLLRGKSKAARVHPTWSTACRPSLISAISGGQWTQTRKAKLPAWSHGDLCQLCKAEKGTPDHRFQCTATLPDGGWPSPSKDVRCFIEKLSPPRAAVLRNRAVLAVTIPLPAKQEESPGWNWVVYPDDIHDPTHRCYIDGSRRYPSVHYLATTGCGVTLVNVEGRVVGAAHATPPSWVKSASAAETWALLLVTREVINLPRIYTDCLGLLIAAQNGFEAATAAKRPNARIWRSVAEIVGESFAPLRGSLVWMPAHTTVDTCGERVRSDGKLVSMVDWRANQLSDKLAKLAAAQTAGRDTSHALVRTAHDALTHQALNLGAATYAANNKWVTVQLANGECKLVRRRDSTAFETGKGGGKARGDKRKRAGDKPAPAAGAVRVASPYSVLPALRLEPTPAARRATAKRLQSTLRSRQQKAVLAECIRNKASRLSTPARTGGDLTPAAARLAALRARVVAREAAQS